MKPIPTTILILSAWLPVLLGGCRLAPYVRFEAVQEGWTVAQVQEKLGTPDKITADSLIYEEPFCRVIIPVRDNIVTGPARKENYPEHEMGISKYYGHVR